MNVVKLGGRCHLEGGAAGGRNAKYNEHCQIGIAIPVVS